MECLSFVDVFQGQCFIICELMIHAQSSEMSFENSNVSLSFFNVYNLSIIIFMLRLPFFLLFNPPVMIIYAIL